MNVTGSAREVRPGVWEITIDLGVIDGKRERRYHTIHTTRKRELNAELRRLITMYENGTISPVKLTVGKYLESWGKRHKKNLRTGRDLSPTTLRRYNIILNQHLIPALGSIPLQDLNAVHIEDYYASTTRKDGKPISSTTLLYHHRVLSCALDAAVRKKLIQFNPCHAVEETPTAEKKKYIIPTIEQATGILEAVRCQLELFVPIYAAITLGLRRGEIFALKRDDFDLKEGYVNIEHSFCTITKDIKQTKTEESSQKVTLLPSTIPIFDRVFREQKKHMLACGYYVNDGWICAWKNGEHMHPDYISKEFPKLTKDLGYGHMRFHDLRHTHATWLVESDIDIKSVSDRLRHTSVKTTEGYTHLGMKHRFRVAEKADTFLKVLSENL